MGGDLAPEARSSSLPAAERSLVAIARALAVQVRHRWCSTSRRRRCRRPMSSACSRRCRRLRGERHRHRLRHPSARRGLPHRRPGDGAARRAAHGDGRRSRETNAERSGRDDRRPLDERRVRETPPAFRSAARSAVEDLVAQQRRPGLVPVAAGETLGLVGLRGAGHHTVGRAIFGTRRCRRAGRARRPARLRLRPRGSDGRGHRLRLEPAGRGKPRAEYDGAREYLSESGARRQRRVRIRRPARPN